MLTLPPSLLQQANSVVKKSPKLSSYSVAFRTTSLPTIAGNCSTAAYNPLINTLMTSDNGVPVMHEFHPDGTYRRQITLSGFTDVEAVCWIEGTRYAISEEGNPGVVNAIEEVDIPQTGAVTITKGAGNWVRTITTGITSGANLGIEGLAFDPKRQLFYCVTEKANAAVWNVWQVARTGGTTTQLFSLNTPLTGVATDISDMHFNPSEDMIYLVSHESLKVMKFTLGGALVEQAPLPSFFTQLEGVSFTPDMGVMFVTGEPAMYARMPATRGIT